MRAQLGWIRQTDSHSCGPLSIAAALLLLQVISPTEGTLQAGELIPGERSKALCPKQLLELRHRLLLNWLSVATGETGLGLHSD